MCVCVLRLQYVLQCMHTIKAWHEKTDNNIKEIRELKLMTIIFLAFCMKKRSTREWRRKSFQKILLLPFFKRSPRQTHTHLNTYFFSLNRYLYWRRNGKFYVEKPIFCACKLCWCVKHRNNDTFFFASRKANHSFW